LGRITGPVTGAAELPAPVGAGVAADGSGVPVAGVVVFGWRGRGVPDGAGGALAEAVVAVAR
jgi:hypothetical protein